VAEIQFATNDGVTYQGEISDIIKLSKEQSTKLKFLALVTNSSKVEKDGIELSLEGSQEKIIIKKLQKIAGIKKNNKIDLEKDIKELIQKRIILFLSHDQYERIPDPQRNCIQKRVVVTRLIAVGRIVKFRANVIPGSKKIQRGLAYTTESSIDSGKLEISFSQDKYIIIGAANINDGETMSALGAELLEMVDDSTFEYSLEAMECPCGGTASPTLIDVTYRFKDKEIAVQNVPVLQCHECGQIYNDTLISLRTETQALKAMQENESEIEF
jgi:YgiT-type zinc finger domain-containing protein